MEWRCTCHPDILLASSGFAGDLNLRQPGRASSSARTPAVCPGTWAPACCCPPRCQVCGAEGEAADLIASLNAARGRGSSGGGWNDGRAPGARVGGRGSHGALAGSTRLWPAVHAAVSVMIAAVLVAIWLLFSHGYFWPVWPVRLCTC
jgi:hypothetical protein